MTFVLDASVAANWCFPDESHPIADAALRMIEDGAVAPVILAYEVRNALLMAERHNRISEAQSAKFLSYFEALAIVIDREANQDVLLRFARNHRLTVYDAAYLELAYRKHVSLATLDSALVKAARAEGVGLVGFEA